MWSGNLRSGQISVALSYSLPCRVSFVLRYPREGFSKQNEIEQDRRLVEWLVDPRPYSKLAPLIFFTQKKNFPIETQGKDKGHTAIWREDTVTVSQIGGRVGSLVFLQICQNYVIHNLQPPKLIH